MGNRIRRNLATGVVSLLLMLAWLIAAEPLLAAPRSPAASSSPLPLVFEENRGQADPRVKFLARGAGYVAVDGERYGDDLDAPARDQEDIRAPALIRGRLSDLAEMRAPVAAVDPRRQHQAVQLHDAPNIDARICLTQQHTPPDQGSGDARQPAAHDPATSFASCTAFGLGPLILCQSFLFAPYRQMDLSPPAAGSRGKRDSQALDIRFEYSDTALEPRRQPSADEDGLLFRSIRKVDEPNQLPALYLGGGPHADAGRGATSAANGRLCRLYALFSLASLLAASTR
jgi:hypothetical protein